MAKDRKIKRGKRSETRWRGRAKGSRPMYVCTVVRGYGEIMHVRYHRNKTTVDARSHCDSIWWCVNRGVGSRGMQPSRRLPLHRWLLLYIVFSLLAFASSFLRPCRLPPPLFFSAPKWRKEGIRWDHKEVYTLFSSDSTTQRTRFVQLKIKFAAAGRHPTKRGLGGLHFILYPALIFHARYIACVQQQSSYSTSLTLPFMYISLSTIIRLRSVCLSIFCLHLHCVAIYIDLVYM